MAGDVTVNVPINLMSDAQLKLELGEARAKIKELRDELAEAQSEAIRLQDQLNKIDGGAFNNLENAARRAVYEVRSFLKAFQIDPNLVNFDEYSKSILNGGKTALEVITEIKSKYTELFETFNSQGLDTSMLTNFIARLDEIRDHITSLSETIPKIIEGATGAGGSGDGGGRVLDISDALMQLRLAAEGMPEEIQKAYVSITELVQAVNEYAQIDTAKLRSVSAAFIGLADIGKGSYGSKSMNELRQLVLGLTEISSQGGLNLSLDLSGVKGFKLDTASLDALTNNLPKLQAIAANVDEINKISNLSLDLSGIKGIKFNPAAIESLIKVLPKLQKVAASVGDINKINKIKLDLSGIKNLKIDPTPIEVLTKNLPKIQKLAANVDEINKINNIDFSKLQDIRIDQSSIDAVLALADALKILANNPILQSRFLGGSGGGGGGSGGGGGNGPFGSIEKTIEELERAETMLNNLLNKSSTKSKSWAPQYAELQNAASNIRAAIEEIQAGGDPVTVLSERFGEAAEDITGYANRIAVSMKRIVSEDSKQFVNDFMKQLTTMEKALNGNQAMKGTEQYEKLADVISRLRAAFDAASTGSGFDADIFVQKLGESFTSANGAMQECTETLTAFNNESNKVDNVVKKMNEYYDAANKAAQNPFITRGADGSWATEKTAEYGEQVKQLNDAYNEYNTTLQNANLIDTERANIVQMAAVKEEQLRNILNGKKDIMQQETSALNNYNNALKRSEQDLKQFAYAQTSSNEASKKAFADMKAAAQEMSAAFAAWKADPSVENMSKLEAATAKYNTTAEHSRAVITALDGAHKTLGSTVTAVDGAHKTFGATLSSFASKFAYMFSATRIMMAIYRTMKQMVQGAIELDSAMTQLQIVTGETDAQMNRFANTLATAAQRAAVPIKDLIESATTFARLGYSSGESAQLAEFTAMLQNVGNIDTSKAQDAVTSIIKAYGVSVDQIESVMDKLVSVGKMFAQGCGNAA